MNLNCGRVLFSLFFTLPSFAASDCDRLMGGSSDSTPADLSSEILSIVPGALSSQLKITNGTGRLVLNADINFAYYVQTEQQSEHSLTWLIPMASSRFEAGWINTPEWWSEHAGEIAAAKEAGQPLPFQAKREVSAWLKEKGYSTNPKVYLLEDGKLKEEFFLQSFLLSRLDKNADPSGYIHLYRGSVGDTELNTWEAGQRPRGPRYWTPSANYAWRYGRKGPGFLHQLVKQRAPILDFAIPRTEFRTLVKSGQLILGTELTVKVHQSFDQTGRFMDQLNNKPYVGSGSMAPDIEVRARRSGAQAMLSYFRGPVSIETLVEERIKLIEEAGARLKQQYPADLETTEKMVRSRIEIVRTESKLLTGLRDRLPIAKLRKWLAQLPSLSREITRVDNDSLETLLDDYEKGDL